MGTAAQPTIVVTPQDAILSTETAVEKASREAHERLEQAGTATPGAPARERNPDGTFKEAPVAPDARVAKPAPADGTAPKRGDPAAPNAEAPKPEAKPAEGEGEGGEAPAEGEDTNVVILPGRNEGDDIEMEAETPEAAERLRQLVNGYMRGNEVRQAAEAIIRQQEDIDHEAMVAALDPGGFMLAAAQDGAEIELPDGTKIPVTDHVVMFLLSQPEVWDRIGDAVLRLEDPQERRAVRGDQTSIRNEQTRRLTDEAQTRGQVRQNFSDVQSTLGALLPPDMDPHQQELLYGDCLRDLKEHADRYNLRTLPINEIPVILARRLSAYGVNPVEAAARASESAQRRGRAADRRPAPGARTSRSAAPAPKAPAPRGEQFVASQRTKARVSTPAGGAGSPQASGPVTAPRKADGSKMSIEETIAWHRGEVKKGVKRI